MTKHAWLLVYELILSNTRKQAALRRCTYLPSLYLALLPSFLLVILPYCCCSASSEVNLCTRDLVGSRRVSSVERSAGYGAHQLVGCSSLVPGYRMHRPVLRCEISWVLYFHGEDLLSPAIIVLCDWQWSTRMGNTWRDGTLQDTM